jgi:hypothetical protein
MTMKFRTLAPLSLVLAAGAAFATTKPADKPQQAAKPTAAEMQTRDWAKIDLNKDHLISPEEMEKYLAENPGPLRTAKK